MHLEVLVGAVAKQLRAARPEVGEPGDELLGRRGGRLVEMDGRHACSSLDPPFDYGRRANIARPRRDRPSDVGIGSARTGAVPTNTKVSTTPSSNGTLGLAGRWCGCRGAPVNRPRAAGSEGLRHDPFRTDDVHGRRRGLFVLGRARRQRVRRRRRRRPPKWTRPRRRSRSGHSSSMPPMRLSRTCVGASPRPKWPSRETVTDASQGVQLATMREARALLADRLRLAQGRSEAERLAPVRHEHRRGGHSFHPRAFEASERVAADRHARMARLDHRAVEDRRSADEPDGPWRKRSGRVRRRDSLVAGPRVLREAHRSRLGPDSHRAGVDRPDEAPRLHAIRGARGRLGECRHRADGPAGASGAAWHSHQHASHRPA